MALSNEKLEQRTSELIHLFSELSKQVHRIVKIAIKTQTQVNHLDKTICLLLDAKKHKEERKEAANKDVFTAKNIIRFSYNVTEEMIGENFCLFTVTMNEENSASASMSYDLYDPEELKERRTIIIGSLIDEVMTNSLNKEEM